RLKAGGGELQPRSQHRRQVGLDAWRVITGRELQRGLLAVAFPPPLELAPMLGLLPGPRVDDEGSLQVAVQVQGERLRPLKEELNAQQAGRMPLLLGVVEGVSQPIDQPPAA
ncbi:MAG: hypothetical protein ACK56I_15815, partial [bacterium]